MPFGLDVSPPRRALASLARKRPPAKMVLFYDTFHRRPRMAVSSFLARVKREPFADFPLAEHFDQAVRDGVLKWRERLLPPLVTLRLFVLQVLHGNASIAHLRQLSGIDFARRATARRRRGCRWKFSPRS